MFPAVIVIPVYKKQLSSNEERALEQCFKILDGYPVCFVCSKSFDIKNYTCLHSKQFNVKKFDDRYFISLDSYSLLLLSLEFYKAFKDYQYILIYQLDAWVFKNELNYWIKKGYSYIGAPWLNEFAQAKHDSFFIGVGNGGFSLRNVKAHIAVLKTFRYRILPLKFLSAFLKKPSWKALKKLRVNFLFYNNPFYRYYNYPYDYPVHEDVFFGRIASKIFSFFKVPDPKTATKFSIETVPSKFVNKNNLPFGCHAWERFEPEYWSNYINKMPDHLQCGS